MRPHELTAQGLATEFLGRSIARWTCKQLRTSVEAFSKPDARILKARDSKLNVCAKLFSLRPRGRLTHGDWAALYLLLNAEGQAEGLYLEQARALAQRGALKFSPSRPPGTRECQVCTEDLPESAFPRQMNTPSAGSHSRFDTCKDCFKAHIEACGLSTALDEIPCPEAECECVIDYVFMKAFAPDSVFERYDSLLREKACGAEYVSCANEDCDQGGTVDLPFTSFITCQYETRTCTTCKTAWHPHITHDENMAEVHRQAEEAERRRRNGEKVSEEHRSTTFIAGNTKACPGRRCGARVEKNGGCDHMTCTRCSHEFCWICLRAYGLIVSDGNHMHAAECKHYRPERSNREYPDMEVYDIEASDIEVSDAEVSDVEDDEEEWVQRRRRMVSGRSA